MKAIQIITGILTIISLTCTMGILFTQPSKLAVENDTMFAISMAMSCMFCMVFLRICRMIDGSINEAR